MVSIRKSELTWQRAGVLIAVTPVLAWWLERLIAIPSSGWFAPDTAFHLGGDLRTFHTAAYLVTHGHGGIVYDSAAFRGFFAAEAGGYGPFVNSPPLLIVMAPLGWLSFHTAWVAMAGFSVVGIAVSLRLLGAMRPVMGALAALLFAPVYFAVTFGQPTVLWLLILAGTYRLLKNGNHLGAGAVAGLLVMKPTLAAGLAVWWLVDWRRYRRAAVSAVAAAAVYLGVSFVLLASAWSSYLGSFFDLLGEPDYPPRQWAQFSAWGAWRLLFPAQPVLAAVAGALSVAVALFLILPVLRRDGEFDAAFSGAVLLTVLAAPYLIAYDWTLLMIPGVLLWNRSGESDRLLTPIFAAVAVAAVWSTSLVNQMLESGSYAIQLAPLVLLAAVWYRRNEVFATVR